MLAKILDTLISLVCILLSVWQLSVVFEDFFSGATTTVVGQEKPDKLKMPLITICPQYGYKDDMRFFDSEEDFLKNTYGPEEIFPALVKKMTRQSTAAGTSIGCSQNNYWFQLTGELFFGWPILVLCLVTFGFPKLYPPGQGILGSLDCD